jgi:hypothetical protein
MEPNGKRHKCKAYRRQKPQREPAHEVGPRITGASYTKNCADCHGLPWSPCKCYPSE